MIEATKQGNSFRYNVGELSDWGTESKRQTEYRGKLGSKNRKHRGVWKQKLILAMSLKNKPNKIVPVIIGYDNFTEMFEPARTFIPRQIRSTDLPENTRD